MNTRLGEGNVVRTTTRILAFAGLASLALVCAKAAWSQGKSSQAESAVARPVATAPEASPGLQASGATPSAGQATAQNSPAKPPVSKGKSEGITVHGHWVIEVKNPDGSVAKHVEFENSLVTPTTYPGASMNGSQALVALLSGNASSSAGAGTSPWLMELDSLNSGDVSPCGQGSLIGSLGISGIPTQSNSSCTIYTTTATPGLNSSIGSVSGGGAVSSGLPNQFILSGTTSPAGRAGTIDTVFTLVTLNVPSDLVFPFTSATLPAQGSGLCGAANQPACAVNVGAGQSATATVTISFQ